jgi:hypothetical protein
MPRALIPPARAECLEPLAFAVDDAALEPLADRERRELGGAGVLQCGRVDAGEQVEHPGQRVVGDVSVGVIFAAIPDQVERDLAPLVRDGGQRHDLGRVHDRRVEAGFDGLVQEHGVEHRSSGRVEPEGHVRDSEGGVDAGVPGVDLADGFDRLDGVAAGLLLAGGDREGQCVDDDVLDPHPPLGKERVDQA